MLYDVSVIGSGACGNNIVKIANPSFNTIAINSTKLDLDFTEGLENHNTLLIGEEGCGKLRENGKKLVKNSIQEYSSKLNPLITNSEMVIVTGSLGGGTGSGSIPITADIIKSTNNKIVLAIGVLAQNSEDIRALKNTIGACNELQSLGIPYILIDNDSYSDSIKEMFNSINESIVEDMRVLRGDYNIQSVYGNMDVKDCKRLFSTPGLMSINKISGLKDTTFEKESYDSLILKSIKQSYNVQIEKDKFIKRMGIILTVTEEMLTKFDRGLSELKKEIGIPLEIFIHINIVDKNEIMKCSIITILAGMSFPDSRLEDMADIIEAAKPQLTKQTSSNINSLKESLDWMDDVDKEEDNTSECDIKDLLNKWN